MNELLDWLKKDEYHVVAKNQYCYELRASLKNIIIVLDHILQLNLFDNTDGLAKEFTRSDFIKEYFPKLCKVLKATGFLSSQEDAKEGELNKDFDVLDYTKFKIYATLELAKITCTFTTSLGHGEFKLVQAEGLLEETQLRTLLQRLSDFTDQLSLSLLVTNLLYKNDINFNHLKNNPTYLYTNLFAVSLEIVDC